MILDVITRESLNWTCIGDHNSVFDKTLLHRRMDPRQSCPWESYRIQLCASSFPSLWQTSKILILWCHRDGELVFGWKILGDLGHDRWRWCLRAVNFAVAVEICWNTGQILARGQTRWTRRVGQASAGKRIFVANICCCWNIWKLEYLLHGVWILLNVLNIAQCSRLGGLLFLGILGNYFYPSRSYLGSSSLKSLSPPLTLKKVKLSIFIL